MTVTTTPSPKAPAAPAATLGGITPRSTRTLINPSTKFCMLLFAHGKRGKTTMASTLDDFTMAQDGRRTLILAIEAAEGGGSMTLADGPERVVIDTIRTKQDFDKVVAALENDTTYGGVVVDNASDYVKRYLQPYALSLPALGSKGGAAPMQRSMGVPVRTDYQVMGEQARIDFNRLIGLTTAANPKVRKHLLVTALQKDEFDDDGVLTMSGPKLPGSMASDAVAMFNTVATIEMRVRVEVDSATKKPTKHEERRLVTQATASNKYVVGDRTKRIPDGAPLDFKVIWEKYWAPGFAVGAVEVTK